MTTEEKREIKKQANKKYRQSERGKEKCKEAQKKYRQSEKGKKVYKKYRQSKKGKEKCKEINKKYRQSEKGRNFRLKHRYNSSIEEFNLLYQKQEGKCVICQKPFIKTPQIDHDRRTSKIRGLLCMPCNILLGHAKDNSTILENARLYLLQNMEE